MNRSQYVRHSLSGQRKIMPVAIKEKQLIDVLSKIELDMRVLALKEGIIQVKHLQYTVNFVRLKNLWTTEQLLVHWTKSQEASNGRKRNECKRTV